MSRTTRCPRLARRHAWRRALLAVPIGLGIPTAGHAQSFLFDPSAYATLGSAVADRGRLQLDTTTLGVFGSFASDGVPGFSLVQGSGVLQSQAGGPEVAVFSFDDIRLGAGVSLEIFGDRPAVILSRGDARVQTAIDVSGQGQTGRGGGGRGGDPGSVPFLSGSPVTAGSGLGRGGGEGGLTGGGGGHGGAGGAGTSGSQTPLGTSGTAFGSLAQMLSAGSGGGGATSLPFSMVPDSPGGAGGGGIALIARGTVEVSRILANGSSTLAAGAGSGGGVVLQGQRVQVGDAVQARGGQAGSDFLNMYATGGAGGGGRILIAVESTSLDSTEFGRLDTSGGMNTFDGSRAGQVGTADVFARWLRIGPGLPFQLSSGPVTLTNGARLSFDGLRIDTGGLAFEATALRLQRPLQMNGGFVSTPLGLTLAGGNSVRGFGSVQGPLVTEAGSLLAAEGGSLTVGNLAAAGAVRVDGRLAVDGGSTLLLLSADRVQLAGSGQLQDGARLVTVNGLELAPGAALQALGAASVEGALRNQGRIDGSPSADRPLTLLGPVDGVGRYTGHVRFQGLFSPGNSPAVVTLEHVTLALTALLSLEIGGRAPGSFDQLVVSGSAQLGGTLQLSFLDGFVPQAGDSFALIVGGSISGSFAQVSVTGLDPLLRYSLGSGADGVQLQVLAVPEPPAALLLALGLAAFAWRRQRAHRTGA